MPEPLRVAHVSPFAWEDRHEVNTYVREVSDRLAARGHDVVVLAPSRDGAAVREVRAALRRGDVPPGSFLPVSEALAVPGSTSRSRAALPVDAARTVEELLDALQLDVVHVHEPFAPSVSSTALRTSRALNVATFHAPAERLVATQVARKLTKLVFGRIDTRQAAWPATAQLLERFFGGEYAVVAPGVDAAGAAAAGRPDGPVRLVFADLEERAALRLFLRALRRLPAGLDWTATIVSERGPSSSTPLRADLRERVTFSSGDEAGALAEADIVVLASDGDRPNPALLQRALAAGAVPVASRLTVYEDLAQDAGLLFEPRDAETLAAQVGRLVRDPELRRARREAAPPPRTWDAVADDVEEAYRALVARRHDPTGRPELWAKLRRRKVIDVDLHMHTDHSHDCATPVEHLLATARDQGLGAIAITDHNEVSGALEAAGKADAFGVKVIVAEEVKTADQGEVIGLFIQEKIPRGLTLRETVDEIRRQGGLVYVPHPFDRMHAVPDYEHLLTILDDVDAIEVYNPRVAIGSFNEEAQRFAAKYRIVAGAGSDSHVAAGLGTVRIRMHDFDGPEEFLESLRHAEIHTKPGTLLYVQALKFLETKATPAGARRARRERRVRRATRKG